MSKILITGGGGFLGSVLSTILLNWGHQVRVFDNLFRNCDYLISLCHSPDFEFIKGDILDKNALDKAMDGVDGVVHLAALVGEPICKRLPDLATLTNIAGTANVVEVKPMGIPMVFASTGSVYGKVVDVCTEESPLNALSHYALTKIEGEKIVRDEAVIYRFSTAFGVSGNMRIDLLVNDLVYRAVNDGGMIMFQPDFRRSFVHTQDIAHAIIFALENYNTMRGETYNVGHPEGNWTKRQLAEYIKSKTGCFVSYAETGYVDPDQRDYEISFDKIHKMGWHAEVGMEEGIDGVLRAAKLINIRNQYS